MSYFCMQYIIKVVYDIELMWPRVFFYLHIEKNPVINIFQMFLILIV